MARFGKLPVQIPSEVQVETKDDLVKISGPKGSLEKRIPRQLEVKVQDQELVVEEKKVDQLSPALRGSLRSHLQNMVQGVTQGWSKTLELVGVGYRAQVGPEELSLTVGFSHPVILAIPEGLTVKVEKNLIIIEGIDKELVGQFAAQVRAVKKPEPYKGKGIKYQDEEVRRKPGKAMAKTEQ